MFGMNREEQKCQVSLLFDAEIQLGVASMALHLPRPPCRQGNEATEEAGTVSSSRLKNLSLLMILSKICIQVEKLQNHRSRAQR